MADKIPRTPPMTGVFPLAILIIASLWIADSFLDSLAFGNRPFAAELAAPSAHQVFSRTLAGILLAAAALSIVQLSRHRRTEKAFQKLSLQAKLATNAAGDGIYYVDNDGCFTFVNHAAADIFGYEGPELLGKPAHQMLHQAWMHGKTHPPEECPTLQCLRSRETAIASQENLFRRDGESFPSEYVSSPIVYEGELLGAVVVIRDVTERKKYEQALERHSLELEEINRYRQVFADVMHHDLMGPLASIDGFTSLLSGLEEPKKRGEIANRIKSNVAKAMAILEDATKLTQLESYTELEMEDLDLAVILTEVVEDFSEAARDAEVSFEISIPPSMPARANRIISQVPVNLISNALRYAADGGRIEIGARDDKGNWRVYVKDFGEGVPDAQKEALFMRFHRKDKQGVKGHGLGLAISRRICELHGTSIWIEDNPERGAVFVFEVPKAG